MHNSYDQIRYEREFNQDTDLDEMKVFITWVYAQTIKPEYVDE